MDLGGLSKKLNLNHLSEEECEAVLKVIQRDFELRQQEKERLGKIEEEIETADTKADILAKEQNFNENCCMRCFSKFFFIFNAKVTCVKCQYNVCKNCSEFVKDENGYVCQVCLKQRDVSKKSCEWFYNDVRHRFKRFGSAKVVRSLHKRKTESEESDYAMSDSAIFGNTSSKNRRARHSNALSGVFSMDLDENSVNNMERQAALERDANYNAAHNRQPGHVNKPYTCTIGRASYEDYRDAELTEFDTQFTNIVGDIRRVLDDETHRHPSRSHALITRHEYEKGVDNHKEHLQSTLSNLSQSLLIAMDNQEASEHNRTIIPKTSTAKHQLVKQTIQKRVESLCKCAIDLDDERTSEYGSDNSSDVINAPFEESLARGVVRHFINEQMATIGVRKDDSLDHMTTSTSEMSDSSDTPRMEISDTSVPKLSLPLRESDEEEDEDDFDHLVQLNQLATSKQASTHPHYPASSKHHQHRGSMQGHEVDEEPIVPAQYASVSSSQQRSLSSNHRNVKFDEVDVMSPPEEMRSSQPRPMPSPRSRHSTPMKSEPVPAIEEMIVTPESVVAAEVQASPKPAPRGLTHSAPTNQNNDFEDDDDMELTEEEISRRLTQLTSKHEIALPSFEFEPEGEQSEMTMNPHEGSAAESVTSEDDEGIHDDVMVVPSEGNVMFGRSFMRPTGIFQSRNVISAYDNFGQKKVGKSSEQPTVMLVPKGEVEEMTVPKVGDLNADELSDLSENEATSDISEEEDESDLENDLDLDDLEVIEEEDEEERDGFYDSEGHFVVHDRVRPAIIGSGLKRPHAHSASAQVQSTQVQTEPKRQREAHNSTQAVKSRASKDLTVDVSAAAAAVTQSKQSKRKRDDINIPPPSPEIPDRDPAFLVKPEKIVTVMEGEFAKFHVQLTGTAPIDVFWYRDGMELVELSEDPRCDVTSTPDNQHTCCMYQVTPRDQGQYLCIGINEQGRCSRAFKLKVTDYVGEKSSAEFIKKPLDQEARVGQCVKFRCKVKGVPQPRVTWYKDGKLLRNNDRITMEKYGNRDYVLTLDDVSMADDAEFTVMASNIAGEAKCTAQLSVDPTPLDRPSATSTQRVTSTTTRVQIPDFYPDTDDLLRLAEQVQSRNQDTQGAATDMLQSANRLTAMRINLDKADELLNRSEEEIARMDSNNNDGYREDPMRDDARKVRKVTESALAFLSSLDNENKPAEKSKESTNFASLKPESVQKEEEIDLDFTYEQYDLLYRAGLISHEQIRKGSVKKSDYDKIQRFFKEEQEVIQQLTAEVGGDEGNDVIVTAEFLEVLDCGLKRVDSKRYSKDFIVNRETPQMKRRVWKVKTASQEGTEVIKCTTAGEKEVVSSEDLNTRERSDSTEEQVYIAAGKAFSLEDRVHELQEKVHDVPDNATSTEQVERLQEAVVQASAQVEQSEQEVQRIESELEQIKAGRTKDVRNSHSELINNAPQRIDIEEEKVNYTQKKLSESERSPSTNYDHSKAESRTSEWVHSEKSGSVAFASTSFEEVRLMSDNANSNKITDATLENEDASEVKLPSVQNLRSVFCHDFPTTDEKGVKRRPRVRLSSGDNVWY